MQRIQLLSEKVANQIAAGEVIERPASIVKELVENAIDAQSRRIRVEIEAGGRSLIRVSDDGIGMSRDDALLSLERHATSKIREATDLAAIQTMGFRGEALPSISSVSRFTLTTKEQDGEDPDGTQIIVNGGKMLKVLAGTGAPGTCIEVRNLFYNLPARRKFLRTAETERSHIQHYLELAALAHPQIGFTYLQDGKMLFQLPPEKALNPDETELDLLEQRYSALHPNTGALLRVQSQGTVEIRDTSPEADPTTLEGIRIWGLIGAPGMSRSTRADQHLFVNQRPIENRGLNRALIEGYHTSLMKGRYPICCLFLEIDPSLVDVNVHPSKKEVRFRNEFGVRRFATDAVRECLIRFANPTALQSPTSDPNRTEAAPTPSSGPASEAPTAPRPHPKPGAETKPADETANEPVATQLNLGSKPAPGGLERGAVTPASPSATSPEAPPSEVLSTPPPSENDRNEFAVPDSFAPSGPRSESISTPIPLLEVPLRYLGVVGKLYVIYESDRGMVIMDQHAAHERVLFEQMMSRLETDEAPSQRLLLPETLELSTKDAQFLREQIAVFNRLGVGISEFGDQTFLLDALPTFTKVKDARQFALDVIDQLKRSGESINTVRLGEDVIAKTVCRHAVKANDRLQEPELAQLLEDLRSCTMPYTCPHGRPTLIELSASELEKKFGRVQ